MEGDVVLAHEVVGLGLRVGPPLFPRVRVPDAMSPLDRRRQVSDDGVEPHIELLELVIGPSFEGDGNTPVDVACHRAGLDVLQDVQGELEDVGPPVLAGFEPLP